MVVMSTAVGSAIWHPVFGSSTVGVRSKSTTRTGSPCSRQQRGALLRSFKQGFRSPGEHSRESTMVVSMFVVTYQGWPGTCQKLKYRTPRFTNRRAIQNLRGPGIDRHNSPTDGFAADVEWLRRIHLHSISQFKALHSRFEFALLTGLLWARSFIICSRSSWRTLLSPPRPDACDMASSLLDFLMS